MRKWEEPIKAFDCVDEIDPDYPNLKANRRIAEQYLVPSAPVYMKYAPILAIIVLVVLGSVLWFFMGQKKNNNNSPSFKVPVPSNLSILPGTLLHTPSLKDSLPGRGNRLTTSIQWLDEWVITGQEDRYVMGNGGMVIDDDTVRTSKIGR